MELTVCITCAPPRPPILPESVEIGRAEARALEMELNRDGTRITELWTSLRELLYEISNGGHVTPVILAIDQYAWLADAMTEPKRSARRVTHSVITLGGDIAAAVAPPLLAAVAQAFPPGPRES